MNELHLLPFAIFYSLASSNVRIVYYEGNFKLWKRLTAIGLRLTKRNAKLLSIGCVCEGLIWLEWDLAASPIICSDPQLKDCCVLVKENL